MLFGDDMVLEYETRIGLNRKMELWKKILKSMGFIPNMTKTLV